MENGVGVRSLEDFMAALSCKLWWKWRGGIGIRSEDGRSIGLEASAAKARILQVDGIMRKNTRVLVADGSSSFLFDNWSGLGAIVDLYAVDNAVDLRSLAIRDFFVNGSWQISALQEFLPPEALLAVLPFSFQFTLEKDALIWEVTSSGLFTLKSAFQMVRKVQQPKRGK